MELQYACSCADVHSMQLQGRLQGSKAFAVASVSKIMSNAYTAGWTLNRPPTFVHEAPNGEWILHRVPRLSFLVINL